MTAELSIIIPSYNREKLIAETIQSVTCSSFEDWELLIVDDHSTDNTVDVATDLAASDSRIKVWKRKSSIAGAPACRNEATSQTVGKYLIFLDSDDLLHRDCLQRRMEKTWKDSSFDFLVFPGEQFNEIPGDTKTKWFTKSEDSLSDFLEAPAWQTAAVIWHKPSFEKIGRFREDLLSWQDWELHVRALANGLEYRLFDGAPDHFIRRSHHDRISKKSEVEFKHLIQREEIFHNVIELLKKTNHWCTKRQNLMIQRLVFLAIQMHRTGHADHAGRVLKGMKQVVPIKESKYSTLQNYFRFETNSFYRGRGEGKGKGKLLRPFVKQFYRLKLGPCIAKRHKRKFWNLPFRI